MSLNILNSINYGYAHLEPVIVGLMAMNKNFLLIGPHGTGKSRVARLLSRGYGENSCVFYDATKDDLISIAGIPCAEAMKSGHLSFTPHQRSIWNKSTIVVDELTRASRENQNLWLEILEERTCFGMPLSYRSLIATANPKSYAAAFQLDEALLDRFYAVINIPELQENMGQKEITELLELSLKTPEVDKADFVEGIFSKIQAVHRQLLTDGSREKIIRYCSMIIAAVFQQQAEVEEEQRVYISPRSYGKILPEAILSVSAYYTVAGSNEPLQSAALDCLHHCLAAKFKLSQGYLDQLHRQYKKVLCNEEVSLSEKIRFGLEACQNFKERLLFFKSNRELLKRELKLDELEKYLGAMLKEASKDGEKEKLLSLNEELSIMEYKGDILRQVEGRLILILNSAVSNFLPILNGLSVREGEMATNIKNNITKFNEMQKDGSFFKQQTAGAMMLQSFIINVYEGNISPEAETILQLFGNIEI